MADLQQRRAMPNEDERAGLQLAMPAARPHLLDGMPLAEHLPWYPPPSRSYSRRELLADRIVNLLGVALGCTGSLFLMSQFPRIQADMMKKLGLAVYGIGIITMLACSAACHHFAWDWGRTRHWSSLDYTGISAMIAGSYTPPMIACSCYRVLGFVWLLAISGTALDCIKVAKGHLHVTGKYRCVLISRFLIMGWCGLLVFPSMQSNLPPQWFYLTLVGGVLYTVGVPFFLSTAEFHLPVWHLFVLSAAICMYVANLLYIAES